MIEFKYIPLSKVTQEKEDKRRQMDGQAVKDASRDELMTLKSIQDNLGEAKKQLESYRQTLQKKYAGGLNLRTIAIVSVGMKRILWEEI